MDTNIRLKERTKETDSLCNKFDCGNLVINRFLVEQSCDTDISKTFLMIENNTKLIGFFSLSCNSLLEMRKNKIVESKAAIALKMFAIDKEYQHTKIKGYGHTYATLMLFICLDLIDTIKNKYIGAECIILNSTNEGYKLYKNKGGFNTLDSEYELPDSNENIDAIKMYKVINSQV